MDKETGTPGDRQKLAFALLTAGGDPQKVAAVNRQYGLPTAPEEDDFEDVQHNSPVVIDRSEVYSKPPAISFEAEVQKSRGRLASFEQLLDSQPEGFFTLRSKDFEVDFEYFKRIDSLDAASGVHVIRFLLPKTASVRMKPTDGLELVCGSDELPVTFIGDMHDFDGLLPIKMISFFAKAEVKTLP